MTQPRWPTPAWRGRVAYRRALGEQRNRRQAILDGTAPEAVWLLEHPSVFTTGRRAVDTVPSPAVRRALGADLVATERGGLATWHGPGQLVGYLLLDAGGRGIGIRRLVRAVENGLMAWLATRGVVAGRREGAPGVWVGDAKVAAIGLHVRRGVTMHGFALNLDCDLAPYDHIVPCGIVDGTVTTVARLSGSAPPVAAVAPEVGAAVVAAVRSAVVDTMCGGR